MSFKTYVNKLGLTYLYNKIKSIFDNIFVHKTGDEIINGQKTFKNTPNNADNFSYVAISHPYATKGTIPNSSKYAALIFADSTGGNNQRLGILENCVNNQGDTETYLIAYKNEFNNTNYNAKLTVGYNADDTTFATAPSTLSTRSNNTDIVTRGWLNDSTGNSNVVHKTGDETIDGTKTFKNDIIIADTSWSAFIHKRTDVVKTSTSSTGWYGLTQIQDKNGSAITSIDLTVSANYTDLNITTVSLGSNNYNKTIVLSSSNTADGGNFRTNSDNKMELGTSGYRWKQLYAATSTIGTSDKRLKTDISDISDNLLDVWENVKWSKFKFKDAVSDKGLDKARYHTGAIAQDIEDAFRSSNIDISEYGFFCHDNIEATEELYDHDGNLILPAKESSDIYSLRYEEVLCIEAAYQRRKVKRLENELEELKARFALLEEKINNK